VPERVAAELSRLFDGPGYAARAAAVGEEVSREDGAEAAARIIAAVLGVPTRRVAV
jgi:hypothetical protein